MYTGCRKVKNNYVKGRCSAQYKKKNDLKIRKCLNLKPDVLEVNPLFIKEAGLSEVRHGITEEELPT